MWAIRQSRSGLRLNAARLERLGDLSSELALVLADSQPQLSIDEILVLPTLSVVLQLFLEPFQCAVWVVAYSNWRSQHWQSD